MDATSPMDGMSSERERMVREQLLGRGIRSPAVLRAMREVPRERFVPSAYQRHAYADSALPIEEGQTISQPYVVARMLEALDPSPGDRALEVGTGSGYFAAVLSRMVAEVYGIERHASLVTGAARRLKELGYENVHLRAGNGARGWPEHAPYELIAISAGAPRVPAALMDQLQTGGRLVGPVGRSPFAQKLVRVERLGEGDYRHVELEGVQFVPLVGEDGWPEPKGSEDNTR
jgi:protein-L-isoaspartate(D-aspartate) O-methyltransferase